MPTKKVTKTRKTKLVKNASDAIHNGPLTEAIMGFNPGSIGTQLNQVDTIFLNNRWYLISNMRQVLSEAYAEHGLVQAIVDIPVDDGLRGGVEIKSKQMSPEEIERIQFILEQDNIISEAVANTEKWNRLYGGAGTIILTDQDPEEPLNIEAITSDSLLEFRAADMWELFWNKQNMEGYDATLQEHQFSHFSYYGKKLHKSRVLLRKGIEPPSFIRPRLRGWGLSVIETLVNSINQYLKCNNLSFEVLDEFKLDIFKIKNLTQTLLSSDGTKKIRDRVALANQQKNFQNAITMDAEDDYVQKQLSFAGIAEMMREFRMQIASDMRMPMSKLFGIGSTGFSSGEDDIENFNAMIESSIRTKIKGHIIEIIEILCQKEFSFIPSDLQIEFKPLRVLSSEQEENVKAQKFARLLQTKQAGLMTVKEFKDACNKENLLGVQIDTEVDQLETPDQMASKESIKAPMAPESTITAPTAKNDSGLPEVDVKTIRDFESLTEEEKNDLENPGHVDEALWDKAKRASQASFGEVKWAFVQYLYRKWGGK